MSQKETPEPPSMGDERAYQITRFRSTCPICHETYDGFDSDEVAIKKARWCYYRHDETPVPSEDEAYWLGLMGRVECYEQLGGCGWTEERRKAPHDALEFSHCPECGEYNVGNNKGGGND